MLALWATVIAAAATLSNPPAAHAATPAHVQSRANEIGSGTVNDLAFASPNTAGNLIVVYALWSNTGSATVTDTRGNNYASAGPATRWNNSAWSSQVFYARNVTGGANTVRATFGSAINSFGIVYIHEYSGVEAVNPLDASAAAAGSGAAMNSGAAATSNPQDLIFAAGGSSASVTSAGAGFTIRRTDFGNLTADRVVTSAGSYNATATHNSSAWVMHMAAFKAAGGTPGETTPPTIAITSPNNGASVNDIVQVTANASDNAGVAGVEFFVDGASAGPEDANPPYALSWDTRTATNGAHALTARARDTSGNTATSPAVNVNVSNADYFQNEILATGLELPTTLEFLPDGRMLVGELQGRIKVLPPPYTQPDPTLFLQINNVGSAGVQQGIYDIALDPNFATNRFYYVFYTLGSPNHDRVSRFTANASLTGTVAGSEFVLYEDPQNADAEHHGGSLNFDNAGRLLFTTGEHFIPSLSQRLDNPRGKVHRINANGTVPTDNPFYDGAGPNIDSIWARGLRNPFRAYYDAPTGRYYIGDVGGNVAATAVEELNLGVAGANYGWPDSEGACSPPCQSPLYSYPHNGRDASITGGFVYRGTQFPASYRGAYFFADYAQNWIRGLRFDGNGAVSSTFNFEPTSGAVDGPYGDIVYLAEGPDGALYYVDLGYSDIGGTFGVSKIRRIRYVQSNQAPVVNASATSPTSGPAPLAVAFSAAGSSDPEGQPLTYSWNFGDGATSSSANPSHTYTATGAYQARLTVSDGVNQSTSTPITISVGSSPTATISSPNDGAQFRAGDVISYSGDGTDPDDGSLPASAFTWNIDFLHDGHAHPGTPITGTRNGSLTIPTSGHDFSGNTRYRITLTVRDSDGLTSTRSVTVNPQKVNLTFDTVPSGRTLYLDGIAKTAPFVHDTLVGFNHTIEARDQTSGNTSYTFASWSDGGARQHTITVPASPATYTASFNSTPLASGLVGAWSFNEGSGATARDSSANANHGTLVGPATWDPAGKYGAALSLSGLGGNVTVPHAASLNLSSSYTLEAWVKPTALNSYQTVLIKEQTSGCGYWLQTAGNRISSGFNGGGCREHLSGTTPVVPLNQWSHLAAVFNDAANTSVLYLNGTPIATKTETAAPIPNTQPLVFGQTGYAGDAFERWRGLIDEVRIYNRGLSATEIQADMNSGVQSNQAPVVNASATSPTSGPAPLAVAFSAAGSSDPEGQPLTYSWNFGDGATSSSANPSHTYTATGAYQARLTVSDGVNQSTSTPITISVGSSPTATISSPNDGAQFRAGDVISYSGDGTDPDDGSLPASAFTWNIDFLHDGHAHPGTPITGTRNGSLTIPTSGHDFSGNTRYRITLTVRDSDGLTSTRSVTVNPQKVNLTFDTVPSGRTLYLDGIAKTAPFVHDTLVGFNHTIEARDQTSGNTSYTFASWSDGGARQHTITVPASPATYTASFNSTPLASGLVGAWSFNEGSGATARDSSANANHGTLVGPATWDPAGKYGAALSLSGLGGNVTVPHAASLNLSSSYTLEAWVKPTALNSYQTVLIKEQTSGCGYWLQTAGNRISSGFNGGGCREHLSGTTPVVPLNQWSHLAAVFNDAANTSVLYLNGTPIATKTETAAPIPNTQPLVFGQTGYAGDAFERWRGLIDEVRIYNRGLSATEIQADMNSGI